MNRNKPGTNRDVNLKEQKNNGTWNPWSTTAGSSAFHKGAEAKGLERQREDGTPPPNVVYFLQLYSMLDRQAFSTWNTHFPGISIWPPQPSNKFIQITACLLKVPCLFFPQKSKLCTIPYAIFHTLFSILPVGPHFPKCKPQARSCVAQSLPMAEGSS